MKIIVTEISEGIAYHPELHEWVKSFDLDPDDAMFEPLSLMEGDPDILRCNERKIYFMDIDLGDTKFIITSDEVNDEEKKMLAEFHQYDFKERYTVSECNWETFNQAPNAVAYRGGKGYLYTIWLYNQPHKIAS